MIQEQIIEIFSNFLYIEPDEIDAETNIFATYDFNDEDINDIIDEFNNTFEIEIKKTEFMELENIQEMAEYIENLM